MVNPALSPGSNKKRKAPRPDEGEASSSCWIHTSDQAEGSGGSDGGT
jgi:hypothetical protein